MRDSCENSFLGELLICSLKGNWSLQAKTTVKKIFKSINQTLHSRVIKKLNVLRYCNLHKILMISNLTFLRTIEILLFSKKS